MTKLSEPLIDIGYISGPFGLRGELRFICYLDDTDSVLACKTLTLKQTGQVLTVKSLRENFDAMAQAA